MLLIRVKFKMNSFSKRIEDFMPFALETKTEIWSNPWVALRAGHFI